MATNFSWPDFLTVHGIAFRPTSGGWLEFHCPFCGPADRKMNMNAHSTSGGWHCWRQDDHRGRNPLRLVQTLLGCSHEEAASIVGKGYEQLPDDQAFGDMLAGLSGRTPESAATESLTFPKEIRLIGTEDRVFLRYLQGREYSRAEAAQVAQTYSLHGALRGPFRYRLVFPVMHPEGLVGWVGRTIITGLEPRYKALAHVPSEAARERLPPARTPIHACLWQAAALIGGGVDLCVTEGPFDAMALDWKGRRHGLRATCLFGKKMSAEQGSLLEELGRHFRRKWILLDSDASFDGLILADRLSHAGFRTKIMPPTAKDPAALSVADVTAMFH